MGCAASWARPSSRRASPSSWSARHRPPTSARISWDSQGHTIAHPDASLVANFADLSGQPPVAALLAGPDDANSLVYLDNREEWLAGVARAPGLGWGVVVEQPAGSALANVRLGRERAFLAMLSIVVGAMVIGAIGRLADCAAGLAGGGRRRMTDASEIIHVEAGGITEVAGLANAFAEMQGGWLPASTSVSAPKQRSARASSDSERWRTARQC